MNWANATQDRARWLGLALGLGLLLSTSAAAAVREAPPTDAGTASILVATEACGTLQGNEVARLLELELSAVTEEIRDGPPLRVELHCASDKLTIAVVDPLTHKRIERNIPPLADEPGRERVAALAASQLFSASWLELLLPPPPPQAIPIERPPAVTATVAAREHAVANTAPPRAYELMLGAGVRGRSLASGEPFPASRVDALLRVWLSPSVAAVAQLGWDFGQAQRGLGQIRAHAIGAAAGLGWRWRAREIAGVGGHVLVGTSYARIAGRPSRQDAFSAATAGATGELTLGIGPRIRSRRFRLDLDLETGAMLRTPEALIHTRDADGTVVFDEPVTLGGLWVGAVVRIGVDLFKRP